MKTAVSALNTCSDDGVSTLTSPSSSFTCTVTPKGTLPGGYNAHLFNMIDILHHSQ